MNLPVIMNQMARAISELVDRPPTKTQRGRLRAYFDDCCCYCGERSASPHLDHADPSGGNGIDNRLLACLRCNSKEKRELRWEAFLRAKCGSDDALFAERKAKITSWLGSNASVRSPLSPSVEAARMEALRAMSDYRTAYERLRAAINATRADGRDRGDPWRREGVASDADDAAPRPRAFRSAGHAEGRPNLATSRAARAFGTSVARLPSGDQLRRAVAARCCRSPSTLSICSSALRRSSARVRPRSRTELGMR